MPTHPCPALVYGPAYLDFVIRVDRPLARTPIDLGSDGILEAGSGGWLEVVCPDGASLIVTGLHGWELPTGRLRTLHNVLPPGVTTTAKAVETIRDLGGMGAGFAAALGGRLVSALAGENDPFSARIREMLASYGIAHTPVSVAGQPRADSTVILSSGRFGDKLPMGLRGCHAGMTLEATGQAIDAEVVVAASLGNALMHSLLVRHAGALRVLAPSARNCRDRSEAIGRLAGQVDLLAVNNAEWAAMTGDDRAAFEASTAILSITRGPDGALLSWPSAEGTRQTHFEPCFPRARPPVDTNRAGEAYVAHLILALRASGWSPGRLAVDSGMIRNAARLASAAAALVIDMPHFGFPNADHVLEAARHGTIP